MRIVVFLVVVVGFFVSCRVCTLKACFDMLSLEVRAPDGGLVEQFRGTVTLDGQDVPFECPTPSADRYIDCLDAGLVSLNLSWIGREGTSRNIGAPVASVPVRVVANDGGLSWSRTITSPSTWYANGPECGPECIAHTERVVLESN
ncbi:MAG: hypothetical protein JNM69_10960 [Archangium sp.]|nr:hypothetical protein [Archangium sp.]